MRINSTLVGFALGAVMAGGAAQATELLVNGDFSAPSAGGYSDFASIPGWSQLTGDSFELGAAGTYGLPCISAGCQVDEVNANGFGAIAQTVNGLIVGKTYTLSWAYGGRNGGGPQALDVSFGGTPVTTDSSDGVHSFWTLESYTVKATATTEVLEFASEVTSGAPSYGNELTNVSLSGVPEPATWALMLVGFGGLGVALRRRRGAHVVV